MYIHNLIRTTTTAYPVYGISMNTNRVSRFSWIRGGPPPEDCRCGGSHHHSKQVTENLLDFPQGPKRSYFSPSSRIRRVVLYSFRLNCIFRDSYLRGTCSRTSITSVQRFTRPGSSGHSIHSTDFSEPFRIQDDWNSKIDHRRGRKSTVSSGGFDGGGVVMMGYLPLPGLWISPQELS